MTPIITYLLGFGLSLALTLAASLGAASYKNGALPVSAEMLAVGLVVLAVFQLLVQALCFLHLSEEDRPRWRLFSFLLALIVVAIVVGGTLWIMESLGHGEMQYREIFKGGEVSPQAQHD